MWDGVKDAKGRMFLPGEGALLYGDTRDDKPIQCRRDAHEEVTKARMKHKANLLNYSDCLISSSQRRRNATRTGRCWRGCWKPTT